MKQQQGLTLPELLIASVIGLFVMSAALSVFVMSSVSVSSTSQTNQLQDSARLVLRILEDDLAQIGLWGDLTHQDLIAGVNLAPVPSLSQSSDCFGVGQSNNGSFPKLGIPSFRTLWAFEYGGHEAMNCQRQGVNGSDVLQLKRLMGPSIEAQHELSHRYYFISNANEGGFYVGRTNAPSVAAGRRWQYQHHVYYVRNSSEGIPSLYRHNLSTRDGMLGPVSLVEGVERIKYEFGVDMDADGKVDTYLHTQQMNDSIWDKVDNKQILAIRVVVLLRSLIPDRQYQSEDLIRFEMPGGSFVAPLDQYRRRLVSTTVMLRNRVALMPRGNI